MSGQLPPVRTSLHDPRNIRSGSIVSDIGGYYDGQSIVRCADSNLISCVFHHSHNHEGGAGLRVYHCTSEDDGASWSRPQPVEQSLMMPSHDSYQFVHPGTNRIYVIYGYNDGQLDAVDPKTGPAALRRVTLWLPLDLQDARHRVHHRLCYRCGC